MRWPKIITWSNLVWCSPGAIFRVTTYNLTPCKWINKCCLYWTCFKILFSIGLFWNNFSKIRPYCKVIFLSTILRSNKMRHFCIMLDWGQSSHFIEFDEFYEFHRGRKVILPHSRVQFRGRKSCNNNLCRTLIKCRSLSLKYTLEPFGKLNYWEKSLNWTICAVASRLSAYFMYCLF